MRNVFIVLGIMAILVIVWMLWVSTPSGSILSRVGNSVRQEVVHNDGSFSVVGRTICLPFKNTDEPHNDLCRFGIVTEGGVNYALDFENADNGLPNDFDESADLIRITGVVSYPEADDTYDMAGLIQVTLIEPANGDRAWFMEAGETEGNSEDTAEETEEFIEG